MNKKIPVKKSPENITAKTKTIPVETSIPGKHLVDLNDQPETKRTIQNPAVVTSTPAEKKQKKELPTRSGIKSLFKDLQQTTVQQVEEKLDLTTVTVQLLWKEFLKENREKLQNAFLSVADRQVPHWENEEIVFTETNNISLELLQLHKMDIVSYFTRKSTQPIVHLKFNLDRKQEVKRDYKTPKERLLIMIDENPAVRELIKKLDLNLD
ncbi:MAG TPA: hypothetical protein PKO18_02245 [Chitinophagales bacterium]|nr:hypothetical protein [Chitinophagales bacterium]HNL84027.1 hypothetical protein [Chitinophagales bacterium]